MPWHVYSIASSDNRTIHKEIKHCTSKRYLGRIVWWRVKNSGRTIELGAKEWNRVKMWIWMRKSLMKSGKYNWELHQLWYIQIWKRVYRNKALKHFWRVKGMWMRVNIDFCIGTSSRFDFGYKIGWGNMCVIWIINAFLISEETENGKKKLRSTENVTKSRIIQYTTP